MAWRRWSARDSVVVALGLAALVPAVVWLARSSKPKGGRLTITAGRPEGSRHRVARMLVDRARPSGLILDLRDTAGSERALDLVDSGIFDLALVQGGLDLGRRKHVRQVTALYVEPLHLLVRESLAEGVTRDLAALRGKVVNLGESGGGTRALAVEILAFAGLRPGEGSVRGDYVASDLSYAKIEAETNGSRLPDAVFTVSTLPASVVRHLVTRHRYRLVPLPFGEAFALDALLRELPPGEKIERRRIDDAVIPAYTYGVEPAVPDRPLHTLGTRLLVVAHENVAPAAVESLLETIFNSEFAGVARPPLSTKLLDLPTETALHNGSIAYQRRNRPLIAGDVVDAAEKWLSSAGIVAGALFFLWEWAMRRYRRLRDRGFEAYIRRVSDVERRASKLERAASLDLRALIDLQRELGRIKGEALDKFSDGSLEGAELFSGFLAHASDTRDFLTRLILHQRDNLEDEALAHGQSAIALWAEAVGPIGDPPKDIESKPAERPSRVDGS